MIIKKAKKPGKAKQANGWRNANSSAIYAGQTWRSLSAAERRARRWCEACLALGIHQDVTPGNKRGVLDHIIRPDQGGAPYDTANLMALCGVNSPLNHHAIKSGLESRGLALAGQRNEAGELIPTQEERAHVIRLLTGQAEGHGR